MNKVNKMILVVLVLSAVSQSSGAGLANKKSSEMGEKVLSRHRRFLIPQASGWTLNTRFTITIPLQDIGSSLTAFIPFTYNFDSGTVTGRSLNTDPDAERASLFQTLEGHIDRLMGMNGHACLLRTICEAAEVPMHEDGVLGHLINALLLPANVLQSFFKTHNDYILAQHRGQFDGDCSMYYRDCHFSPFKVEEYYSDNLHSYPFNASNFIDANYV